MSTVQLVAEKVAEHAPAVHEAVHKVVEHAAPVVHAAVAKVVEHHAEPVHHAEPHHLPAMHHVMHRPEFGPVHPLPTNLHGFLNPHDGVAISFWIISMSMIASTVFFMWESLSIMPAWKTSMNVGSLVTLIAAVHYLYMREFWVIIHLSPIVYRYIDWSLTVPLQMIEFYLILSAVQPNLNPMMFFRLLVGTVIMILFGYMGESLIVDPWLGFVVGMSGWGFILYEIFLGEASQIAKQVDKVGPYVGSAFATMRFIVSVGWSIYPAGYFFGYLLGDVQSSPLNLIYNLADFVNKIWFCLAIWNAAKKETLARGTGLREPLYGH